MKNPINENHTLRNASEFRSFFGFRCPILKNVGAQKMKKAGREDHVADKAFMNVHNTTYLMENSCNGQDKSMKTPKRSQG